MSASHFNPHDPAFLQNPYPVYRQLQAETPQFFHEESGFWYFTRHEDVSTLLRDRRLGRSITHVMSPDELNLTPAPPEYEPFTKLGRHSMFDQEPPGHTRLRSLVHKAFTPARIREMRHSIQAITDGLLDTVQPNGQMDVLEDFAVPLPVTVIAELLGIPQADRPKLRPWSNAIVKMYELDHTPAQAAAAIQAAQEFADYLKYLAQQRRQSPQDDLITALVFVEEAGDQLTEDEFVSTCVLLLNAGHEATVNVIGNGLWALLRHPAQFQQLQANLALVSTAVEELMRFDTPLQLFRRWVLHDIDYKGIPLKKGTEIALLFGAANHDAEVFANPQELDLTRDPNPHITFGGGVHYCLGAPLARMELQIAFETLLRRFPDLKLIDEPEFHPTYVIRGLKSLWVG
jgi:cytochrome P450